MSLLEDVFLQDEADEAQELERVIEGDEYDERPRSRSVSPESDENVIGDDEAEEDKRRVDPTSTKTKRVTKNPRFLLNPARLTGPRGIQVIRDHFKDFKFKGKGHEKEDLDMVLKKLEHWAYRLYPKFQFEDCLKKIETLGKKRPVMVHLQKIRSDQFITEDTVVQKESSDEDTPQDQPQEEDEFDKLLQLQIDIARAAPSAGSVNTPRQDRSPFAMPKATSSPSISDEQKERMMRNRKLAEERRLARLQKTTTNLEQPSTSNNTSDLKETNDEANVSAKKPNRSNVIDSSDSDDECNVTSVNQAITVEMHTGHTEKENIGTVDVDVEMEYNVVNDTTTNKNVEQITDYNNKGVQEVISVTKVKENCTNVDKNQSDKAAVDDSEVTKVNDDAINRPQTSEDDSGKKIDSIESQHEFSDQVIQKESLEQNITKEIQSINESNTQIDSVINIDKENKDGVDSTQKESIEDELNDVMDVDFSEDF